MLFAGPTTPEAQFERLVATAGNISFFESGPPVHVARAPGRLDVMGGIADYSGSLVLEEPIAAAAVAAVQVTDDGAVTVRTESESVTGVRQEARFPIDEVSAESPEDYPRIRERFRQDSGSAWAAYVAGSLSVLTGRSVSKPPPGLRILLSSDVPAGSGVASSAAIEVAAMSALASALQVTLEGERLAALCQEVENQIAGAPCGIMDQMTAALGRADHLLKLRCNPASVIGHLPVPEGVRFFGINSGVKHSVGGSRYTRARVGAFMAVAILRSHGVHLPDGYLCGLSRRDLHAVRCWLPHSITGADFLERYGDYPDPVTRPDPEETYYPRSAAEHAVNENCRVFRFSQLLAASARERGHLEEAGALMYASHWSYGQLAMLGCEETDLLVRLLREAGPEHGVLGAKITGGGCGGTVAVMSTRQPEEYRTAVLSPYEARTGIRPEIVQGSSPGAVEWGVRVLSEI